MVVLGITGVVLLAANACSGGQEARPQDLAVGDPAPGFSLPSSDGSVVSLSQYLGNTDVLLYFNMAYG